MAFIVAGGFGLHAVEAVAGWNQSITEPEFPACYVEINPGDEITIHLGEEKT